MLFFLLILPPSCIKSISFSATADSIGNGLPNRQCAANISIALKMNKCNGATNHFAPMYWCCQHQENPRKMIIDAACL
jgi:hypothetical protein